MKIKLAFIVIGLFAISSAFITKKSHPLVTFRYRVTSVIHGTPDKLEVNQTDISNLTKGTGVGQYTCNVPITAVCTITVNNSTPDGFDGTTPYYFANSIKITNTDLGTFQMH